MPETPKIAGSISAAVEGELVPLKATELVAIDKDGQVIADGSPAATVRSSEVHVITRNFNRDGLLARKAQLLLEVAAIDKVLKAGNWLK